jgi:diguanylate cyclase (GGDEF)-like protein/putative nucleotidyltransferase with HDIG domain
MTRRAWIYVWCVLLTGTALAALAALTSSAAAGLLGTFFGLMILATLAQLFKVEAPDHQTYYATLIFLFASLLLLPPSLFVLVVIASYTIEWIKELVLKSPLLRNWYLQPFNIATHIIAGLAAGAVLVLVEQQASGFSVPSWLLGGGAAMVTYVVVNHALVGVALSFARRISLRESGVLDPENLTSDLILLALGLVVASLWEANIWLVIPALSPLLLMYRALKIPQLKREAQTDEKTGLLNARHFMRLFTSELKRATRFNRPLAYIMSDLDLLRNVNNTYGHLAGDTVLAGIGEIMRSMIREYDIAARFGGEEFAIVLPETEQAAAQAFAERIREKVEATGFKVTTSPVPIHVTLSLGIACFPGDASAPNELIHKADVAVYQAKLQGRNRVISSVAVPHFVGLEEIPHEDEIAATRVPELSPVPEVTEPPPQVASDNRIVHTELESTPGKYSKAIFALFVGGISAVGILLTIYGLRQNSATGPMAMFLLAGIALTAELLHLDLYGSGTISVSLAINFAAALISGLPGVALVSASIAVGNRISLLLGGGFRLWPGLYKTTFNWGTHLLAGLAPTIMLALLGFSLSITNLPLLLVFAVIASFVYYAIETGLITLAMSLEQGISFLSVWREKFQWLIFHYLGLCLLGLFLAIGYTDLGAPGILIFALPILMMRYAQSQYVDRTEGSIRELKRVNEELHFANREILNAAQSIRRLNDELFLTLSKIIDARDPYVSGHASKVAEYAKAIAMELGLSQERTEYVRQSALLHDIGKIGISEQILHKPAHLNTQESDYVKTHAALGAEFLKTSRGLRHLAPFVRHHHERWDGTGYPDRLRAEAIPLEARIVSVCDAVEAMASDRPYSRAMSVPQIVAEVKRCSGTQFDPQVAEALVRIADKGGAKVIVNSAREVTLRAGNSAVSPSPLGEWLVAQPDNPIGLSSN